MGQGGQGDGLGLGGEVVGHPDQAQGVGDGGVGGEVAEPAAGEREGLGHRPGHDEPRPSLEEGERARGAGAGELGVRLVDDDERLGRGLVDGVDDVEAEGGPRGVVRRAEEDDVGLVDDDLPTAEATSRSKAPAPSTPRIPSIHVVPVVVVMIGCIEYAGVKPRARRPGPPNAWRRWRRTSFEPLPAQTWSADTAVPTAREVPGEGHPQGGELAVGVPVEAGRRLPHGRGDRLDDDGRHRVGVLVGVERDGDVELRGAVGRPTAQVGAQHRLDGRAGVHAGRVYSAGAGRRRGRSRAETPRDRPPSTPGRGSTAQKSSSKVTAPVTPTW